MSRNNSNNKVFFVISIFSILGLDIKLWQSRLQGSIRPPQKKNEKKTKTTKKEEKIHCLQGANPVLPQGERPPRGNSGDFFWAFWDVMGSPMNSTENNDKSKKTAMMFSRDRFIFFGGVILEV